MMDGGSNNTTGQHMRAWLTGDMGGLAAIDGTHADPANKALALRSGATGAVWVIRFNHHGRTVRRVIGDWPAVSLAEARAAVEAVNKSKRLGRDPLLALPGAPISLESAIRRWEDSVQRRKNLKRRLASMRKHLAPILDTTVSQIDYQMLADLLYPLATTNPGVAGNVMSDLSAVLDHAATERGDTGIRNPARLLKRPPRRRRDAYPSLTEIGRILRASTDLDTLDRLFLRFLILTGARTGEAMKVRAVDIDRPAGRVILRAAWTKNGSEHWLALTSLRHWPM